MEQRIDAQQAARMYEEAAEKWRREFPEAVVRFKRIAEEWKRDSAKYKY